MPLTFTITIDDENLTKLVSALAGAGAPSLTATTSPPATSDGKKKPNAKADAKQAEAAKAAEAAAAAEPAAEDGAAGEAAPAEQTTDLVTEKQKEAAQATCDATEISDIRSQLSDYYVGQGSPKKDVQSALAGMSEEELKAAYLDYLARLVKDEDGDFVADFETPYIATRINDGAESKQWVVGGVTLSAEQVAEKKLADPNPKAAPAKKGPALPTRKK